jgi:DNA-binding CsgD family transcriptional regulator
MNDVDGDEPFPSELLGRLAGVVPANGAAFNERNLSTCKLIAASGWCGDDTSDANQEWDDDEPTGVDVWQFVLHHPVNVYRRRTGYIGALANSDFYRRSARVRHDVFEPEYHAFWGIVDAVGVRVSQSSIQTASLWLESGDRDFSERDKLVLDVLRPHLAARHRHARLRRLLADALAALEAAPYLADAPGVVLVDVAGRVEFASPAALRLLEDYFGEGGTTLPRRLEEWRQDKSQAAFEKRRDGRRLVVDTVGSTRSALVLYDEHALAMALTAREWDVMRWVEAGKKNDEIAHLLCITPGTVKKHLEHVYAKLGVRTRTAALAQVRPRLAASTERDFGASAAGR